MKLDLTVAELAALVDGRVEGAADRRVAQLCSPEAASGDDLAVIFAQSADVANCRAGCLMVGNDSAQTSTPERSLIRVTEPEAAFDRLTGDFGPVDRGPEPGIHPSAVVAETAEIDATAALGAGVFVGAGAQIGAGCVLWPGVCVGPDVTLGSDCLLHYRVVVEARCRLGDRVELHAGVVIGADGFGYRREGGSYLKSPQVGWVELGDDVEIGANSTVDRGRLAATVIGDRTKLDDAVHVGHNCRVGKDCALAGHAALGGCVELADGVLIGGNSGIAEGLSLPEGVVVGACSLVFQQPEPGQYVLGMPSRPHGEWKREVLSLSRLPDVIARLKRDATPSEADGRDP